jgi:hypothetical protein
MQGALANALGRIEMSSDADDENDEESSNQHLRMAIQNVGELLEGMVESTRSFACSQVVIAGVRAITMLGSAACEHSDESRARFRDFARENLRRIAETADLPRSSRVRQALSA